MQITVKAISTEIYRPGEDFFRFLIKHLKGRLKDGNILVVTSKIVSLSENRRVLKSTVDKHKLIQKESDKYLGEIGYGVHLTIKQGMLIPSAGIDESNAEGDFYILYPENPFLSAKKIHGKLKKEFRLKRFGVLITDSHTVPLRRGVMGAALAYCGFKGVESKIGQKDLFGRVLKMTQINVADALAVTANLSMGEGGESRPLAILKAPVTFANVKDNSALRIPLKEDLYKPLLQKAFKD